MGANANFASTVKVGHALATTANTNVDGTGTIADILSAGGSGSHIDKVRIRKRTATADTYRLFLHDGTSYYYYAEIAFTAGGERDYPMGIDIPSGWKIGVSVNAGEDADVFGFAGDY